MGRVGEDAPARIALLERERELGLGEEALAAAAAGSGGVLVIEGVAGIGKSRLLEAIAERAAATGLRAQQARGGELERGFSFGVVQQLLAEPVRDVQGADRERLFRDAAALARPLFEPALTSPGRTSEDRRFQLLHGLHWLVAGLAETAPLLLALDDAQWADEPSLSFLAYLARRIEDLPALIVVASRTGQPTEVEPLLTELRGHATRLELETFSPGGVASFVRALAPDADRSLCAACAEATGGNPFYLAELVRALRSEPERTTLDPRAVTGITPRAISDAILTRIAPLGEDAEALAAAVAVLGEGAPLRRAGRLARLEPDRAADAADALVGAGVLGTADPARFAHPIVAQAVRADVPDARRGQLHLAAAELLHTEGVDSEWIAAQLLEATPGEAGWVVEALRNAARVARARGAPAAAVDYLRRAGEEAGDPAARGAVLAERGLAAAELGAGSGVDELAAAVELLESARARGRALFDLAVIHAHAGRYRELRDASERGLVELGDEDSGLRFELESLAAQGYAWTELLDPAGALERLRSVFEQPRAGRSIAARLALASASVRAAFANATAAELAGLARRALDGFEPTDHPFDAAILPLAGLALALAGELEDAEETASLAVERALERGSILDLGAASFVRSFARHQVGDLGAAIVDAEQAVEAGRHGWGATLPMAHAVLALALLDRGDPEAAEQALELPEPPERWMANVSYGFHLVARGEVLRARGDREQGLAKLLEAGQLANLVGATNPTLCPWRPGAAVLLADRGDSGQARELIEAEERLAASFGAPRGVGIALRARARVGERGEIDRLEEAAGVLAGSPARLERARTLIELGAALRRDGKRQRAREPLREGIDLAHRCGGGPLVDWGLAELRLAGARPRRPALHGVAALTPAERRVVALAGEGLGNREIAQRLFVTRRTVEMHLSNAYPKLGVSSRNELPAVIAATEP